MGKRTPGVLNRSLFSTDAEFEMALKQQGEQQGWTPLELYSDDDIAHTDTEDTETRTTMQDKEFKTPQAALNHYGAKPAVDGK